MSLVTQLRSERAQHNAALQALAKKEAEGATLSAEDLAEFTRLEGLIGDLNAKIQRAEVAEKLAAQAAVPMAESATSVVAAASTAAAHITVQDNAPPGLAMAQIARLLCQTNGNQQHAAQLAADGGYGQDVVQALSTVTAGAGGVLVPTHTAAQVIEALRPKSVVRKMGAVSMPLVNGNMTMARVRDSAVLSYLGTETDIPVTDMAFEDLKLTAKKAGGLIPISNDLLKFQGVNPRVDNLALDDMLTGLGLLEDITFLRSAGSAVLPKGLRHWALAANVMTAGAGATLADLDLFLGRMMLRIEAANANLASCGWVMHPRVLRWLQSLRDGNGNKAYPEIEQGNLKGYPVGLTTQLPTNLGIDTNQTEIYFADFADCYIGENEQVAVAFSTEASYKNGNGDMISAFQRDQTLIRVIVHNDFGPRHVESIAVGIVTWGAGM